MTDKYTHELVAKQFVDAKVFDFEALGGLIAKIGPELTINDKGWHGVTFGKFNLLACQLPADTVERLVGNLHTAAIISAALVNNPAIGNVIQPTLKNLD